MGYLKMRTRLIGGALAVLYVAGAHGLANPSANPRVKGLKSSSAKLDSVEQKTNVLRATKPLRLASRRVSGGSTRQPTVAYAVISALLYNLSIAFTVPVFPKIVNTLVNNGNDKVTPESAAFYGTVTGTDQLLTFLLVNGACSLSDKYGRKPFL